MQQTANPIIPGNGWKIAFLIEATDTEPAQFSVEEIIAWENDPNVGLSAITVDINGNPTHDSFEVSNAAFLLSPREYMQAQHDGLLPQIEENYALNEMRKALAKARGEAS
jgi:hypothetical protein